MTEKMYKVLDGLDKVEALLYAIETCYLDWDSICADFKLAQKGVTTFYKFLQHKFRIEIISR